MRLLDLFCGAGGAAMGYHRAGFEVVGVDIAPQPNYPFDFIHADAIGYLEEACDQYDAVHASPPCQTWTAYRRRGGGVGDDYADLIASTREALQMSALLYVIENVPEAPLENATQLCGSSFGLGVRRHRMFETNWMLMAPPCFHGLQRGDYPSATNRTNRRKTCEVGVWRIPLTEQQAAMGVDWMTLTELTEAIPPAYTEHIGAQLMEALT